MGSHGISVGTRDVTGVLGGTRRFSEFSGRRGFQGHLRGFQEVPSLIRSRPETLGCLSGSLCGVPGGFKVQSGLRGVSISSGVFRGVSGCFRYGSGDPSISRKRLLNVLKRLLNFLRGTYLAGIKK